MSSHEVIFIVDGYVRVSTDNQLENYSIDEQIERIRSYCAAKGWTLRKIYTDGGYSGGNINRPALQELLTTVKTNPSNAVVVYKLDRLSRSQKDTLTLIEDEFLQSGVDFISINENFDTSTPFGRAMIGILSVFAQLEKDQITERFTMGRIGRGKAGYFHGGGVNPTGYVYNDGNLEIDEFGAIKVREVFDNFLNGFSINAIAETMREKYHENWSSTKVRYILTNSLYIGKVKFSGSEYDGKHKPIISVEQFSAVNKLLGVRDAEVQSRTFNKTPFRADHLLSSLIYCARCGAKYCACNGKYKCYSRSKTSKRRIIDPNCKNDHWPVQDLDQVVVNNIKILSTNDNILTRVLVETEANSNDVDISSMEIRIKNIQSQINRLVDLYQLGTIPMDAISSRISKLDQEKETLQNTIDSHTSNNIPSKEDFINRLYNFNEHFSLATLETKRFLISSIVESIWIDGQNVDIKWRL